MDEHNFPLSVNLEKISTDKDFLPFVRTLAIDLMNNPYISLGSFFSSMSDGNVSDLMDLIEANDDNTISNVLLITEMLAQAEGLASTNITQLTERSNSFMSYVVLESLYRKKLIKLHHDNMSFGDEYGDRVVAERID